MKIATWNIERLKHKNKITEIVSILETIDADILVLTETDSQLKLAAYPFQISTKKLSATEPINFAVTENRVTIYSKYKIIQQLETFDNATSCCTELETEFGNLKVYGTIIGIYGNRNINFKTDLIQQINDWKKISAQNNLCVIGDYNISFIDNYYFTNFGRETLNNFFNEYSFETLTKLKPETIDHISISRQILHNAKIELMEWNEKKLFSDHKGIGVIVLKKTKNGELF